jgi:hypothetical protein
LAAELVPPPDENYHDAHFYWRLELHPESAANQFTNTTVGNSTLSMTSNAYAGSIVRITRGKGAGQERAIQANSPTAVAVTPPWTVIPDSTSHFVIAEAGWKLGASSPTSPVEFPIPNRGGATLQVTGRSANANGQESAPELSPLTRWQIGGGSGSGGLDSGLPPEPTFALGDAREGSVSLGAVAFATLENTRTITGGTLTLYAWNELQSPSPQLLAADLDNISTVITLTAARSGEDAAVGDLIQIEGEILRLTNISSDGLTYTVERGAYESAPEGYPAGSPVYYLERSVFVVPFVRDFFGSPASGQYTHPIYWPDVRVSAADFTVTNVYGLSPRIERNFTSTSVLGLRTLSGGQLTLQVDGPLAIGSSVTPILLVERRQAIREIYAVVADAPMGDLIRARVNRNGVPYAQVEIISGMTQSARMSGFGLPPLQPEDRLTVDILHVPSSDVGTPGRDLTVILSR